MRGQRIDRALALDGVLLLDKPLGPTSNRALQCVKRIYGARKAGHAGTLDPLASGLLPILFGEATKFANHLSDAPKVYEATVLLGVRTSTGDLAGDVIEQKPACISRQAFESAAAQFKGVIFQTPPMHSAIKLRGRPLYELARRGEIVERQAREVRIDELDVLGMQGSEADIRVRCSKGTYIRVLAEDLGRVLGCGATLKRLRRIGVGPFEISGAVTLENLELASVNDRGGLLLPVEAGLAHFPVLVLEADAVERVKFGQSVLFEEARSLAGTCRLYEHSSGRFLGLGHCDHGSVRPVRLVSVSDR